MLEAKKENVVSNSDKKSGRQKAERRLFNLPILL